VLLSCLNRRAKGGKQAFYVYIVLSRPLGAFCIRLFPLKRLLAKKCKQSQDFIEKITTARLLNCNHYFVTIIVANDGAASRR